MTIEGTHGIFGKGQAKCLKTYSSIFRVYTLFFKKKKITKFSFWSKYSFQSSVFIVGTGGSTDLAWIRKSDNLERQGMSGGQAPQTPPGFCVYK